MSVVSIISAEHAPNTQPREVSVHLPVVFNLNIGHAQPRCIIPFGLKATVDAANQVIKFEG